MARLSIIAIHVLAASILFYFALAIDSLGEHVESWFEAALGWLILMCPALLITGRIAWLLRRPESAQSKVTLWLTLPISIGVVAIGTFLICLAYWRTGTWGLP